MFITLYSGQTINPLDIQCSQIQTMDIAHALSMKCRYAGHCARYYSVAEHSYLVACWLLQQNYHPITALWGLFHDAPEAYLFDIPSPLKVLPQFDFLRDAEIKIMEKIARVYDLAPINNGIEPAIVKQVDKQILLNEIHTMMPNHQMDLTPLHKKYEPLDQTWFLNSFKARYPHQAKEDWLNMFDNLKDLIYSDYPANYKDDPLTPIIKSSKIENKEGVTSNGVLIR